MPFNPAIAERAVGQFPLSVATSLAIESACGIHPEIQVARAPILKYPTMWVNARTLFRNFMGSLPKDAARGIVSEDIAEVVAEEMDQIESIIRDYSNGRTQLVFYYSNYANMERKYKHAVLRMDNTPKQKEYTAIHNNAMEMLIKHLGKRLLVFELKLRPETRPQTLLLTHYAYDLVSNPAFASLALLESHTGAIKERAQWYTKYYQGKELPMIPFREDFLQVFGDNEHFRPMDIRLRRELIDVATKYKWSAVTTKDKILYGINQMQNPYARDLLKDILV
jgi:hypothetical protein